jgi:hypothetical protein
MEGRSICFVSKLCAYKEFHPPWTREARERLRMTIFGNAQLDVESGIRFIIIDAWGSDAPDLDPPGNMHLIFRRTM